MRAPAREAVVGGTRGVEEHALGLAGFHPWILAGRSMALIPCLGSEVQRVAPEHGLEHRIEFILRADRSKREGPSLQLE